MRSVNSWNLTNNELHQLFKNNNEYISIKVRGNTWEPITRWLKLDSRIFKETTSKARITLCDIESLAEIYNYRSIRWKAKKLTPLRTKVIPQSLKNIFRKIPIIKQLAYELEIVFYKYSENISEHLISIVIPARNEAGNKELFIIHPPEKPYLNSFIEIISNFFNQNKLEKINVISGHINPQIIETIKNVSKQFQDLTITCSNPGFKLISELWNQRNPNLKDFIEIQLPKINIVKKEQNLELDNISLELIPIPTARWPGGLIIYERNQEILLSEKIFSAHIASSDWSETNRVSTEIDRKHFYDCLMAPMSNQVVSITEKISNYDIKTIAPLHGPAIEYSLKSFLNDYIRWGENLSTNNPKIALIYASAYGNTASIGDALAKGINRTSVEVESINCEFTPNDVLVKSIQNADGYLIGSPTLGGHAPTPIVSALGTLLSEGNRDKPVGIFGSFGWSGEAIDLLETKLKDGGFKFSFDPIRIKFSPN